MENKTKAILAVGGAAAVAVSGLAGAGLADDSNRVAELEAQVAELEAQEPVVVTETVNNTVEVPVEVEKIVEVEVDNENLHLVLDHIYDNDGNVEYLTEDLDDDEVKEIVDRVIFIDEIKKLAVDEVKKEGVDELDKEMVGDVELDEDEIERFKVEDDDDEIVIDDVFFEDGDAEVLVEARFEQDDVDYKAVFRVEFKEGEVDDIEVESIELR